MAQEEVGTLSLSSINWYGIQHTSLFKLQKEEFQFTFCKTLTHLKFMLFSVVLLKPSLSAQTPNRGGVSGFHYQKGRDGDCPKLPSIMSLSTHIFHN